MRILGIVLSTLIGCFGFTSRADALSSVSVDPCLASQLKTVGKGTAATLACHAKAASKGVATDGTCVASAGDKLGYVLAKLESKRTCLVEGTGATRTSDAATFASTTDTNVGHAAGKCDAAKTALVGKYVAALLGCYAKAAGTGGAVAPACVTKAQAKLTGGIAKAEATAGCSHTGQAGVLQNDANAFADAQTCALDPANPSCATCGNGISEPSEPCDASVSPSLWNQCGPEFACVACNCACPTSMTFSPDASAPETFVDRGWVGTGHHAPLVSGGDVRLQVSCPATSRPCGTCVVSGPIANPDAGHGQLDAGRCSTNTARTCMMDIECASSTCLGGGNDGNPCGSALDCPSGTCSPPGTCEHYAGPPQAFSAAGIGACTLNRFVGAVAGTLQLSSGSVSLSGRVATQVYAPIHHDNPCPRCTDPGGLNDGIADGTCSGGARFGLPCDANGSVPGRPDFGLTSLDCPPIPNALLSDQAIDLTHTAEPVVRSLGIESPNCTASAYLNEKCLCDTCNDVNAEPCTSNADCPASGGSPGICGGKRCLAGTNAGAPCSASSACPGGACGRPGQPTQPSPCLDDTSTSNRDLECADPDGDGVGVCTIGPLDQTCSLASGHGQRHCFVDADCGGVAGSCEETPRSCFPTGGGTFQPLGQNDGTDTLIATGMADPLVRDQSDPTLVSVFCLPPVASVPLNSTTGLPGPARLSLKGRVTLHP